MQPNFQNKFHSLSPYAFPNPIIRHKQPHQPHQPYRQTLHDNQRYKNQFYSSLAMPATQQCNRTSHLSNHIFITLKNARYLISPQKNKCFNIHNISFPQSHRTQSRNLTPISPLQKHSIDEKVNGGLKRCVPQHQMIHPKEYTSRKNTIFERLKQIKVKVIEKRFSINSVNEVVKKTQSLEGWGDNNQEDDLNQYYFR